MTEHRLWLPAPVYEAMLSDIGGSRFHLCQRHRQERDSGFVRHRPRWDDFAKLVGEFCRPRC